MFIYKRAYIINMEKPLISVVIAAYNEAGYIESTLKSVNTQTYPNLEVIVVSNGSSDNTADIARSYTSSVYETPERGVAKARNMGAKKAKGDILCFIDADTTADHSLLEKAYLALRRGYVGGKAKIVSAKKSFYNNLFWFADNLVDETLFYNLGVPNICSYTPFVFCKKGDFNDVGGFDEDVVATEEIRLLHKLKKKGRIAFIKDSQVIISPRRAEKQGQFYGGFLLPFYHFFFPKSKKMPYSDIR